LQNNSASIAMHMSRTLCFRYLQLAGAILFATICTAALPSAAAVSQSNVIRSFPSDMMSRELAYERAANRSPTASVAMHDELVLAGHVHRMGQHTDYQTAVYVRNRLAADGFDAKIVTYDVSNVWPIEQHLEITAPAYQSVNLYEPAIPGDRYSYNHQAIGRPYSGFSDDGDAQGPLVYANYGSERDFAQLKSMGVQLHGAIVIVKMGHGSADSKGRRVVRYGGKALLLYPEPGYDPYIPPKPGMKPYPLGPARPLGAALRNTMLVEYPPGDPLSIGVPVLGAKHLPWSTLKVAPIPVSAVTALVAQQLLMHLSGALAPKTWSTKIVANVRVGGAGERVHYVLRSRRFIGPIWDVIATLKGSGAPNEMVVIGGHRDAWTYGTIDPISGTVAMLQLGDAFAKLHAMGWHPFRSVIIGSWDGEELNLFGSAAWAEQHATELRHNCWAYINTDEVAFGPTLYTYATDDLTNLIHSAAQVAQAPNGTTVTAYWAKQDLKQIIFPPGLGSDHETFTYHLGIPSGGVVYGGEFGTYHSAYDNPASLRIFDPNMRYADAAARYFSILMLRLADAPYPDVRLSDLAGALQRHLNAFGNSTGDEARRTVVVRALQPYITQFSQLAAAIDNSAEESTATDNLSALADLRVLTFRVRAVFYAQNGIPGQPWQGSMLYNDDNVISTLPSLELTLDPKQGDAALNQLVSTFARLPPLLLIYETRRSLM
jgi:N-acetylated-alpha-linked acidic dipeptidase